MYTCGLTVYARGHIGNFRTFVCVDVLRRALKYVAGYKMHHVMNFTDVDDKTIAGAGKAGLPLREYTDQYITAFRDDAAALGIEAVEDTPRATDHDNLKAMADMINALGAARTYLHERRIDLLQDLDAAVVRQAGASRSRGHPVRRARRLRRVRQGKRPRLRAVEGDQAGRADVGLRLRSGPAGLAHRVLGHGAAAARRPADRHSHRRRRPGLPASRERDRAERRRHRPGVLALLVPRRAPARRQPEDVEVGRQRLHGAGRARQGLPPVGAALHPAVGLLPQAAELHVDGARAGRRGAAPHHGFSRPRRSADRRRQRTPRSRRA